MISNPRLVAAACLAAFCPMVPAQDPDLLPADTTFVAHFDVPQLVDLIGVDSLLQRAGEEAREATGILRHIEQQWGFDLWRDIRSVTLFGSELSAEAPQIMLVTTARLDGVLDGLRDQRAVRSERSGGVEFLRLDPAGVVRALGIEDAEVETGNDVPVIYVRRLDRDRRAVLIGARADDIAAAARVLEGEAPSLGRRGEGRLGLRPAQDAIAYVEVAANFEQLMERTPASKVASKVHRVVAQLSRSDDTLTLELAADTDSARDARDVAAIVDGLRGLVSLAGAGVEEIPEVARDIIASLRARAEDERVTLRVSASLRDLRDLIDRELGERRRDYEDERADERAEGARRRRIR